MNTLPPASLPSASASAKALSGANGTNPSNSADSAAANAASSDTGTSGNFHQVMNQQMAQSSTSGNDAKASAAQAASPGATAPANGKPSKSTHGAAPASAATGNGPGPGELSSQQAAAIAAAAQASQSASSAVQAASSDGAASAEAAAAGLTSGAAGQLAGTASGPASADASEVDAQDLAAAGDTTSQGLASGQGSVTPASVWGASDPEHRQMSLGREHDASAELAAGFTGSGSSALNAAGALQMTQRTAMSSAQSFSSDSGDRLRGSSDIPIASPGLGASDATLAAAQTSTTQVAGAAPQGTASATVASASVPYQMGSDAWRADVSSHVLYFSQQDISSAQLHLNPAHLSPLNISISVDNNQTSIAFNAAHEATRQAMQDSLPQLREMFNAHGIALGQTTVGDSSAGSAQQREQSNTPSGPGNASLASKALESSSTALNAISGVRIRSLQIVDTFA